MKFVFLPLTLLFLQQAMGQSPVADSITRQTSITYAINQYHDFMGVRVARLYNGEKFTTYDPSIVGHAFFETDSLRIGSVLFDGVWYQKVPMKYDIIADKLVIANAYDNLLCPVPELTEQFLVGGHTFVHTAKGYYDVLCSGVIGIRVKRFKQIEESSSVQEFTRTATEADHYYMIKDGVYHFLANARSLLALLGDKRAAVRQNLRRNKISLRKKNKEQALVKAAEYYNQLSR
jgi:hypothetical protein